MSRMAAAIGYRGITTVGVNGGRAIAHGIRGLLYTVLEGCFKGSAKGSAVGRNRPKSVTILATLCGVRCIGVITICSGALAHVEGPFSSLDLYSIRWTIGRRARPLALRRGNRCQDTVHIDIRIIIIFIN